VGSMLGASAFIQTLFTALLLGRLVRRLGLFRALVLGLAAAGAVVVAFPLVPLIGSVQPWQRAAAVSLVYAVHQSSMLMAGTALVSMSNLLCAREPQRSGAINGYVAFAEGIGKMLGPALLAPMLAWALSARPAAEVTPSGALLVFVGLAIGIGALALAALVGLPRQLTNDAKAAELGCATERFRPLDEEEPPRPVPPQTKA
jgi:MFS family permease